MKPNEENFAIRKRLQALDDEGNAIWLRMKQRGKIRADWLKSGMSLTKSDADRQLRIDGFWLYQDINRLYQINQERSNLVDRLAKLTAGGTKPFGD